ncbi:Hsp20 family protein [Patescibacteria group bacterium]|nr:Hsp20 family protein [Patescibacteria group bacterium]
MSEDKPTIHIRIRDLRREKALTQEELAEALGLSRQSINAMEAGRCLPSLPVAMQIASFFAVPLATVFDLHQHEQNNLQEEPTMSPLVPWSPLREMREALDELMDETANWQTAGSTIGPAVNITQDGRHLIIELALPGFRKEDLSIEVGEDFLTIAGQTGKAEEETGRQYYRREFAQKSFRRTVSLPALVESAKAEAEMKHGILTVTIPKVVEEKPKTAKINIKSAE